MENSPNKESCKRNVMSRIEYEHIFPRSRAFFRTRECLVWALWLGSVLVGALAIAVMLFVVTNRQYGLYEATHENFFTFMVDVLPFLWIIIFGLMIIVGVRNIRHTKKGYRYPLWQIFGSSMVLSLAGGTVLQIFGLGYSTDHMLGQKMGMYNSQDKIEQKMWQDPAGGRLLGQFEAPLPPPSTLVSFIDVTGQEWQVNIQELSEDELALLEQEVDVRLIGKVSEKNETLFYTCGAFPWVFDRHMSRQDLSATREAFIMKVQGFKERAEHNAFKIEERQDNVSLCSKIVPVRRMETQS